MSLSSSLLRFAPLILPLVAVVGAVLGLAIRQNSLPYGDHLLLATIATLLSGIVIACIMIGSVLLVIDLSWASVRPALLTFFAGIAIVVFVVAYFYGSGLGF